MGLPLASTSLASSNPNLLGQSQKMLVAYLATLDEPAFRAKQIYRWLYQGLESDIEKFTDLSKATRSRLGAQSACASPELELISQNQAPDGTEKFLFQTTPRSQVIETVLIPHEERNTLCISSQVGCAMACSFCATGARGFLSNLSAAQIIGQVWAVAKLRRQAGQKPITNVVFMGMGEPLLNLEPVLSTAGILMDPLGFGLSKRRVTLSTCGIVPSIDAMCGQTDAALAVSLHAPDDALRNQLVPINQTYPIAELLLACQRYLDSCAGDRFVTFEYIMLKGVNDHLVQAKALARLLREIPCKINLIPYNPCDEFDYETSSDKQIDAFAYALHQSGYVVTVRRSRGDKIQAACGQLAGQHDKAKGIGLGVDPRQSTAKPPLV